MVARHATISFFQPAAPSERNVGALAPDHELSAGEGACGDANSGYSPGVGTSRIGTARALAAAAVLSLAGVAVQPPTGHAEPGPAAVKVCDFAGADASDAAKAWRTIDDVVMGGVSRSSFDLAKGRAVFSGTVSGDNNGGFASARARVADGVDLRGATSVVLRVRGDGQRYKFSVRTDDRFDGVSYRASFTAPKGDWSTVKLAIADFEPTWRGRRVPGAPALRAEQIRQVGFLISDKQFGPFRLEIQSIHAATD